MKYDIYFHNDFDGRASAAVILSFLRSRGDSIEHFVPVNYDLTPQWLKEKFFVNHRLFKGKRNPAIVVDFTFHPAAAIWFDHHPTTFKREEWRGRYKEDKYHRLDTAFLSNSHLAYTALKENFGWKPPAHFKELIKWLDIIDAARFISPEQTIKIKEPALEIDAYIDATEDNISATKALIKLLAERPLTEIAKLPQVQKAARVARKEKLKSLAFYKKNLKMFGDTTLIDLTDTDLSSLRFAPYYLHPKSMYAVRMTKSGRLYHIGVGGNPWIKGAALKRYKDVHIGELLRRFGGGGHKRAGACEFRTKRAMVAAAETIIPELKGEKVR